MILLVNRPVFTSVLRAFLSFSDISYGSESTYIKDEQEDSIIHPGVKVSRSLKKERMKSDAEAICGFGTE